MSVRLTLFRHHSRDRCQVHANQEVCRILQTWTAQRDSLFVRNLPVHPALCTVLQNTFTALLIFDCGIKLDNVYIRSRLADVCRAVYRSVVSSDVLDFCVRFSCCAAIKCNAALDCSISCYAVLLPYVSGQGPISSMQTA